METVWGGKGVNMHGCTGETDGAVFREGLDAMEQLATLMLDRSRINLSGFRHDFLVKMIRRRMTLLSITTLEGYVERMRVSGDEENELLRLLGLRVTHFFRNPEVFSLLESRILPLLMEACRQAPGKELRIWCAGCSSGEEAYSMAMLASEAARNCPGVDWYVFGTDINEESLQVARQGRYTREVLNHVRLGLLDRYFLPCPGGYEVEPGLRRKVWFSRADVTASEQFGPQESLYERFHVILCRNVLLYQHGRLRERAMRNLSGAMTAGGCLVLGEADFPEGRGNGLAEVVYGNWAVYRQLSGNMEE